VPSSADSSPVVADRILLVTLATIALMFAFGRAIMRLLDRGIRRARTRAA
jgi:hypothetical protein